MLSLIQQDIPCDIQQDIFCDIIPYASHDPFMSVEIIWSWFVCPDPHADPFLIFRIPRTLNNFPRIEREIWTMLNFVESICPLIYIVGPTF